MKYGEGFWVVKDGVRVKDRKDAYPKLKPFEYADGTGDCGWALLEDFTFDYFPPGSRGAGWRFTVKGDPDGDISRCFDYDGASRPAATREIAGDKMDFDVIVPSFGHDLGYCIHDYVTGFERCDWDEFLGEVMEAYGAGSWKRTKFVAAVSLFGRSRYAKSPAELEHYKGLVTVERVAL